MERRMIEHKTGSGSRFASKYKLHDLMYYENYSFIIDAIDREKQLKNWRKAWKWNLIKEENPKLKDLSADWFTAKDIEDYRKR